MREYEVVYIFDPSLDEDAVNARIEKYHDLVTQPEGASVIAVDHWGARQLAYPIRKLESGYYLVAQFQTEPEVLPEFERQLKLDDELIRFLLVISEGEPTSGMSVAIESHGEPSESDDDDDDEDDEEDEDDEDAHGEASPPVFSGGRGRRRRVDGPRIELLNYKDVSTLSRFVTEQGKVLPRRTTKVTAPFQRQLGRAVKRARFLALLPYVSSHDS